MKYQIGIIVILAIAVGVLSYLLYNKRRQDIIKLLITREMLPAPAKDTTWLQGGACNMSDGSIGKVSGNYCEQIKPL